MILKLVLKIKKTNLLRIMNEFELKCYALTEQ